MKTKQPTQREAGGQETRARIVTAAREVFRAKGFDRASMRDIIDAAQLSGAGVAYHHFKSKEAIVQHILEEQVERDFALLSEKIGEDDLFDQFINMSEAGLRRWLEGSSEDIFLDLWPKIAREEAFQPFLVKTRAKFDERFRSALNNCVQAGVLDASLDIEETVRTLIMLGHGLRMRYSFCRGEFDFEATAATMRTLYRALLRPTAAYPKQQH